MALALGLILAAVMIQSLQRASEGGERWIWQLRERQSARRTLALLRGELAMARHWDTGPDAGHGAECPLGGRTPVLRVEALGRPITYSIGSAPSKIWRGDVLMRCGPAYGLDGQLSDGQALNRVVIDGMEADKTGLRVIAQTPGVMRLTLKRSVQFRGGMSLIRQDKILVARP
ncbi:MAG: prepilin-type cleavage/methylation domain-containing protein [Cyanobacteriota bacterium]|nr:prepilin-type cleavage/methylation domain-containing protein [Cyanobacteriota bacterium]